MTTQAPCVPAPILSVVNNTVTALSTDVANFFEKLHQHVIRDIEKLLKVLPKDRLTNFGQTVVTRENPSGGAPIQSKAYRMTRDGFTLLVMGWTGEKALQFKLLWLDAFNRMEEELRSKNQLTYEQALKIVEERNAVEIANRINSEQQFQIKRAVSRKAYSLFGNRHYSNVWNKIKDHYRIPRYTHLPAEKFQDAMQYIQSLTREDFPYIKDEEPEEAEYIPQNENKVIPLPANVQFIPVCDTFTISLRPYQDEPKALPAPRGRPRKDPRHLTDEDLQAFENGVYYFDNLFKPLIQWACNEAIKQRHPKATQFYDVWCEPGFFIARIKRIIERNK